MGKLYVVDKYIAVYTSRDVPLPIDDASQHVAELLAQGVGELLAAHECAWSSRWRAADVQITGDEEGQGALRVACYHLIGVGNPEDEQVSIGARGLTGEAYKGHVFGDTDIFMLPFYVFTYPQAARAALLYRYHTLAAARAKARAMGYKGALYAWESADTGEETTPEAVIDPHGNEVYIITGRTEDLRRETEESLEHLRIRYSKLIMRPEQWQGSVADFKVQTAKQVRVHLMIDDSAETCWAIQEQTPTLAAHMLPIPEMPEARAVKARLHQERRQ